MGRWILAYPTKNLKYSPSETSMCGDFPGLFHPISIVPAQRRASVGTLPSAINWAAQRFPCLPILLKATIGAATRIHSTFCESPEGRWPRWKPSYGLPMTLVGLTPKPTSVFATSALSRTHAGRPNPLATGPPEWHPKLTPGLFLRAANHAKCAAVCVDPKARASQRALDAAGRPISQKFRFPGDR